eukprot:Opistho-2@2717
MQCQLSGRSLRDFAKAVQCMSKIGDDLHIESVGRELHFRTVSNSRSAYASVSFGSQYFDSIQRLNDDGALRCKVLVKSCHNIFRSLPNVEKSVERCVISLKPALCRLVFQLMCKFNITKTINLDFQDSDILQAVYSRDQSANCISVQANILTEFLSMFPPTVDEVTLVAEPTQIRFKSYIEPGLSSEIAARTLYTEVAVDTGDLDRYSVPNPVAITFCLKEFKAILAFCEAIKLPISINFDAPGSPIIFSATDNVALRAEFVLATLQEDGDAHLSASNNTRAARANRDSNDEPSNVIDTQNIATPHPNRPNTDQPSGMAPSQDHISGGHQYHSQHNMYDPTSQPHSQPYLPSTHVLHSSGIVTSTPLTGHTVVQRHDFMALTSPAVGPRGAIGASPVMRAAHGHTSLLPNVGAASYDDGAYGAGSMATGVTQHSIPPHVTSDTQMSDATTMEPPSMHSAKRGSGETRGGDSFVAATPNASDAEDDYVEATPPRKRAKVFSDEESD